MSFRALVVVGMAGFVGAAVLPAAPAAAHDPDSRSCVTQHEWSHVKRGMKKKMVHALFDTRGVAAGGGAGGAAGGGSGGTGDATGEAAVGVAVGEGLADALPEAAATGGRSSTSWA